MRKAACTKTAPQTVEYVLSHGGSVQYPVGNVCSACNKAWDLSHMMVIYDGAIGAPSGMRPNEYQRLALVTEFTPDFVRLFDRATGEPMSAEHNTMIAKLLHATLGMMSEVGEIADALKKHIIYGKALDEINILEETGDESWYVVLALTAVKKGFEEALERNIAKLKARYGDKFSEAAALNRDLDAERKTLEETKPG